MATTDRHAAEAAQTTRNSSPTAAGNGNKPPRKHRPDRWARLKKQLAQARADLVRYEAKFHTEKNAKNKAYAFIIAAGLAEDYFKFCKELTGVKDEHKAAVALLVHASRQKLPCRDLTDAQQGSIMTPAAQAPSKLKHYAEELEATKGKLREFRRNRSTAGLNISTSEQR